MSTIWDVYSMRYAMVMSPNATLKPLSVTSLGTALLVTSAPRVRVPVGETDSS